MKKLFLLSLVALMVGTASAAPAKHTLNAGKPRVNKSFTMLNKSMSKNKTAAQRHADAYVKGLSVSDLGKGSILLPKAEGDDAELLYLRPRATFELAFDFTTGSGVGGYYAMAPAFAPLTWKNVTEEGVNTTWYYSDMFSGEELSTSTEKDLVMTPDFTAVGYITHAPWLTAGETNEFQDPHDLIYGFDGAPITFNFSDGSSLTLSSVGAYDAWSDSIYLDDVNCGLNCVYYNVQDPNDPELTSYDDLWTRELQDIYSGDADNISNARLNGLVQFMPAPASPYIMNNVRWRAYWISTLKSFNLKLQVVKPDENGNYTNVIAEATSAPLGMQSEFRGRYHQFSFKTELEGGGFVDGVVIDGPVALVLTGFHDEGMDASVTNFLSPIQCMVDYEMKRRQYWDAGSWVSFDYNNEGETQRLESFERIQNGFYTGATRDTVMYTSSYPVYFDVEFPFIYSADSKIELPAEGGNKETLVMANHISEIWEVTDEEGNFDLPEWINVDFVDNKVEGDIYNDSTNVTFTVDALPEGVEGREAKILISYPSFEAPAVVKEFRIVQGKVEDEPAEHSELYLVGGFNDWDVAEDGGRLVFAETEEGVYETKGAFLADSTEFKIITPDPNATDPAAKGYKWFGGLDENNVGYFLITDELLEQPLDMINGSNFRLPKAGYYFFTVKQKPANDQLQSVTEPLVLEVRFLYGDVNCDGSVNAADVTALYGYILNGITTYEATSDVNGDGSINAADVTAVYKVILGSE